MTERDDAPKLLPEAERLAAQEAEPRPMPPHVRARVQRTMDWVAERLLEIEGDDGTR